MPRLLVRRLLVGLLLGALLRAVLLPFPGTPDVEVQKAWAFAGAEDVTALYGVGGTPTERGMIIWRDLVAVTAYPPVALYWMAGVGVVYGALFPDSPDSSLFTALTKIPALVSELALIFTLLVWGRRLMGDTAAVWAVLAVWLNPAVIINGPALGYLDSAMAMPAAMALLATGLGRPGLAGVLLAIGVFTKPQPLVVGPVVLAAVIWYGRERWRSGLARFVLGGAVTAAVVVLPYVLRGAWWNMLQALSRLGEHDMVSGYGLNVWWIVTWVVRSAYAAGEVGVATAVTAPVEILGVGRLVELGFPNVKPIGTVLVLATIGWALWRARRGLPLAGAAFLAGWAMLAYFTLAVQVHENHLYLAVPLLVLAGGLDARYRSACWAVSIAAAFNMFIFYGIGNGLEPRTLRQITGVDLTVIAAAINVGIFAWLTWRMGTEPFSTDPTGMGTEPPARR